MKRQARDTIIVRLEHRGVIHPVLRQLFVDTDPNKKWRFFQPGLLAVMPGTTVDEETLSHIKTTSGVLDAICLSGNDRLASRSKRRARSSVSLPGDVVFTDGEPVVIAGPCSVESRTQVLEIAEQVKEAGATALRGGAFKPRTTPYSFGGLEECGLKYLTEAREITGLPVVTEAMSERQLDLVAEYADMIQIGSRNMHNFPFLFQAGSHPLHKPVLLKRGFGATIDEFLGAAEYVLLGRFAAGADEPGLVLCERGIRSFETATRSTLDIAAIPVIKQRSHLPIIADPSHAAGNREYVNALGLASVAAGADGLLVEVHGAPDEAWCDGTQSLGLNGFRTLMEGVRRIVSQESQRVQPCGRPELTTVHGE